MYRNISYSDNFKIPITRYCEIMFQYSKTAFADTSELIQIFMQQKCI